MDNHNNNTSSHKALDGTKTADNLMRAFEHEAAAAVRGSIYSREADRGGDASTRRMLDEMQDNGISHGELWLGYLDEIEDTMENLARLSEISKALDNPMYSDMARIAEEEGFYEIADKFRMAAAVKNDHADRINERMSALNGSKIWDADTPHRCPVCGYTVRGNNHPEVCPFCVHEWL
jgi:rubrerythrin